MGKQVGEQGWVSVPAMLYFGWMEGVIKLMVMLGKRRHLWSFDSNLSKACGSTKVAPCPVPRIRWWPVAFHFLGPQLVPQVWWYLSSSQTTSLRETAAWTPSAWLWHSCILCAVSPWAAAAPRGWCWTLLGSMGSAVLWGTPAVGRPEDC